MLPFPELNRALGRMAIRTRRNNLTGPRSTRLHVIATVALLALAVGGCETNGTLSFAPELSAPAPTATLQEPDDVKYFPSDEALHLANEHFNRGDYGVAERYYREAVEKAPRDVTAWIGL